MGQRDATDRTDAPRLSHLVVAAGTPTEWARFGAEEWTRRLRDLAEGADGADWVTLVPHHGPGPTGAEIARMREGLAAAGAVPSIPDSPLASPRHHRESPGGPTVIVEPVSDGRVRFADTVERLRLSGLEPHRLDEDVLSRALLRPAAAEPDLVVVLGPGDVLPTSLVWELAYSELVFLDGGWDDLRAEHLRIAVDDFALRSRRFGGVDP